MAGSSQRRDTDRQLCHAGVCWGDARVTYGADCRRIITLSVDSLCNEAITASDVVHDLTWLHPKVSSTCSEDLDCCSTTRGALIRLPRLLDPDNARRLVDGYFGHLCFQRKILVVGLHQYNSVAQSCGQRIPLKSTRMMQERKGRQTLHLTAQQ